MNKIHLIAAPLCAVLLYIVLRQHDITHPIAYTGAITIVTAWWWITEALPIPITSLVPFVMLPFGGIIDHKEAAGALGDHVIVLLLGAFMLAKGIERSGVHERLALSLINKMGAQNGVALVFAFMVAVALLSMWISNTAAVLALLPVAMAIVQRTDQANFQRALILGLAYASSLGGVGTLIGTPPNVIFASVYETFSQQEYGFVRWSSVGIPVVIIGIPVMALWLTRGVKLSSPIQLPMVGEWQKAEVRALAVFAFTALLWISRTEPFGGWSHCLALEHVGDASIALLGVLLMFIIPNGKNSALLDWETAARIPWGVLLLFAGGICLAKGFVNSGLSELIGQGLHGLTALPIFWQMLIVALVVSFLTEITSNTATATLLMPILASAAVTAGQPLEWLMIPAAISCSCAFCLPVATAPNSIVFATERIRIQEMAKEGVMLNVLVGVIVSVVCYWVLV